MLAGAALILGIACLLYYSVIVFYAGIQLSFSGIWILLSIAGLVVSWVLKSPRILCLLGRIPRVLSWGVGLLAGLVVCLFVGAQACIISGMVQDVPETLDGMIVLGAQVRGKRVSKALAQRLDRAGEYLLKNSHTYVIVSGGQGPGEEISEAQAMKENSKYGIKTYPKKKEDTDNGDSE